MNSVAKSGASRVADVTLAFWIIKILSTGMGETLADYLDHTYSPPLVVLAAFAALVVALIWQLRASAYSATRYWLAVVMVSVAGTLVADAIHVVLGIPYVVSTAFFAVALLAIFWLWHRREGNLEMSQINSRARELFYWITVMATFALGTAAGDWMAMSLGFGFFTGALVFTALFALPLLAGRARWLGSTIAFWLAYTFTRPMGASFADWLALPPDRGGLGFGTLEVTGFWAAAMLVVIVLANGGRGRARQAVAPK